MGNLIGKGDNGHIVITGAGRHFSFFFLFFWLQGDGKAD